MVDLKLQCLFYFQKRIMVRSLRLSKKKYYSEYSNVFQRYDNQFNLIRYRMQKCNSTFYKHTNI